MSLFAFCIAYQNQTPNTEVYRQSGWKQYECFKVRNHFFALVADVLHMRKSVMPHMLTMRDC